MTQVRRTDRDERDDARGAPSGAPAQVVRVRLLGGFSVSVGTRVIEEGRWRLKRAVNLVKLLVLTPSRRLHREQVMDLLWARLE